MTDRRRSQISSLVLSYVNDDTLESLAKAAQKLAVIAQDDNKSKQAKRGAEVKIASAS